MQQATSLSLCLSILIGMTACSVERKDAVDVSRSLDMPESAAAELGASSIRSLGHLLSLSRQATDAAAAAGSPGAIFRDFVDQGALPQSARLASTAAGGPLSPATDVLVVDAAVVGAGAGPVLSTPRLRMSAARPVLSVDPLAMSYEVTWQTEPFDDGGDALEADSLPAVRALFDLTRRLAQSDDALSADLAAFQEFLSGRIKLRSVSVAKLVSPAVGQTIVFSADLIGISAGPIEGHTVLTVIAKHPELSIGTASIDYQVSLETTAKE